MKIGICDDELQFLESTCQLIEQWANLHRIKIDIYRFTNGDDLLQAHCNECLDLIFLDVIMPLLNGIDTARELRNNNQEVPIIFLTASREFAVDSYEVKAYNYLIKPLSKAKLFSVLDEFYAIFEKPKATFTAQTALGFCKINLDEVEYLEAQNKKVNVYLSNGTLLEIREQFSKCEEYFTLEKGFFRCHRSYIVNLAYVEQFTKTQVTTVNSTIPISRHRHEAFKDSYFNHMFQ